MYQPNYEAQADRAREFSDAALIDSTAVEIDESQSFDEALESANLLSLDDISREYCIYSLIETMSAEKQAIVVPMLQRQIALGASV